MKLFALSALLVTPIIITLIYFAIIIGITKNRHIATHYTLREILSVLAGIMIYYSVTTPITSFIINTIYIGMLLNIII